MTAWQTDDEYMNAQGAVSLPPREYVPYRTPSTRSRKSRRSARSITPPAKKKISPSRNGNASKRSSRDITTDEQISILDPRRFTPTLHANLVSEILSLRRDQEEKTRVIESLESTLQTSREEQEALQNSINASTKETRSLQRQLSLLEGGTSSALGDLSRERDEAVDSAADIKKRLEAAQKKIRNQEEDSQRVHDQWAEEKENWEDEKRKYERRIHVAESRLKIVLDEVEAYQANHVQGASQHGNGHESEGEDSGRENDAASVRTMSLTSSIRYSLANGPGFSLNGFSLADELKFDDTDEQTDIDGRESVFSSPRVASPRQHRRTFSRESVISKLHRKNKSIDSVKRAGSVARGRIFMNQSVLEALEGEDEETEGEDSRIQYSPISEYSCTDAGAQYSAPPSPMLEVVEPIEPEPVILEAVDKKPEPKTPPRSSEVEANQRKKRVSLPLSIEPPALLQRMVSSASQTVEVPLTPPKTPNSQHAVPEPSPTEVKMPKAGPKMVTSSTQTEAPAPAVPPMPLPPLETRIPSISIQPPTSRPASPHSPKLPQYFKDIGCQVNIPIKVDTVDSCSQTEAIQIDKRRLANLPAHLQPSSITSRPTSPHPSGVAILDKSPLLGTVPPRNPRRLESSRYSTELPSSPISISMDGPDLHEFNDDLLLSNPHAPIIPPRRFSSLFSGFYTDSDEIDEFGELDFSDSEYRTALTAPRPPSNLSRTGKRSSVGTVATSPDQHSKRSGRTSARSVRSDLYSVEEGDARSGRSSRATEKSPVPAASASSRNNAMRNAAMAQTGMVNYPTIVEPKNPPPFPIPARASSRKPSRQPSISTSIPSDGRSTPSNTSWHRRSGSRTYQVNNVRRVRSANNLPRHERHHRTGSRTPPLSPSTEAPDSPGLPPLPRNDITTPRNREDSSYRRHRHQPSNTTVVTANTEAASQTSSQSPGVVDAIAQTMVGEWMFKYVRRRKSFGVGDSAHKDETSNDRHKRWVWIAPYERAILWSSKQPSSGSALLGKTGRKLAIQSVLDVKDDNPSPRGITTPIFNRSILILTPQRALKFTASTAERHYLWLTALSFLAHSYQAVPDVISPQPQQHLSVKQRPLPNFEPPRPTKLTRGGIRDSIRLAKGRAVAPKTELTSMPSIPDVPTLRMGDVASFRVAESVSGPGHAREISVDAAEPPMIRRFNNERTGHNQTHHGRKRSNTGGNVHPPLSFRGFSPALGESSHHSANSTAGASIDTAGSSDIYPSQASTIGSWGIAQTSMSAVSSQGNFFDAIGTVRMEAFISPHAHQQYEGYQDDDYRSLARKKSKEFRRRTSRHRRRAQMSRSARGSDEFFSGSKTAGEEDFFQDDPFSGF
ncbi:hypothetical protein M441DRAFT_69260 [Trichoderma asperellum CBS 433.97]|uniref:Pleckstrin homology domain-containing protein n=1 Tax=Trichoderma asperellum (strain ATCC 204424 / CBS 433.97 / NBRC 101777) TaxID=1042311 RepID=A0A2T3Z7N1_TRIA4|nr:hypothetical protein M441DRAFT_69260 [Trichoderma asperellum CBS 433.97]PTB40831.1 hypothetical protein M441DRAFT_69260 [Trichoderma asperellum CBS 433.97]